VLIAKAEKKPIVVTVSTNETDKSTLVIFSMRKCIYDVLIS